MSFNCQDVWQRMLFVSLFAFSEGNGYKHFVDNLQSFNTSCPACSVFLYRLHVMVINEHQLMLRIALQRNIPSKYLAIRYVS